MPGKGRSGELQKKKILEEVEVGGSLEDGRDRRCCSAFTRKRSRSLACKWCHILLFRLEWKMLAAIMSIRAARTPARPAYRAHSITLLLSVATANIAGIS